VREHADGVRKRPSITRHCTALCAAAPTALHGALTLTVTGSTAATVDLLKAELTILLDSNYTFDRPSASVTRPVTMLTWCEHTLGGSQCLTHTESTLTAVT